MEESEYYSKMGQADDFLQRGGNSAYYAGYVRGLRRRYHGDKFGTKEDHDRWMGYINDKGRTIMGCGYQDGFAGKAPEGAGDKEL